MWRVWVWLLRCQYSTSTIKRFTWHYEIWQLDNRHNLLYVCILPNIVVLSAVSMWHPNFVRGKLENSIRQENALSMRLTQEIYNEKNHLVLWNRKAPGTHCLHMCLISPRCGNSRLLSDTSVTLHFGLKSILVRIPVQYVVLDELWKYSCTIGELLDSTCATIHAFEYTKLEPILWKKWVVVLAKILQLRWPTLG